MTALSNNNPLRFPVFNCQREDETGGNVRPEMSSWVSHLCYRRYSPNSQTPTESKTVTGWTASSSINCNPSHFLSSSSSHPLFTLFHFCLLDHVEQFQHTRPPFLIQHRAWACVCVVCLCVFAYLNSLHFLLPGLRCATSATSLEQPVEWDT